MATWDDVDRAATALPEVTGDRNGFGWMTWRVRRASFAWERPLGTKDLAELGDDAPDGPVLAVRLADEGAKHALVADDPQVYFTTSHFAGYAIVLVRLDVISIDELRELLEEAWLARAPKRLAREHSATPSGSEPPS